MVTCASIHDAEYGITSNEAILYIDPKTGEQEIKVMNSFC